MSNMPGGLITFLFTDIEGSTKLWERCPEAMRIALARHDAILREAIERNRGHVFKTVGDAFCAAFPTAREALSAALESHLALKNEPWVIRDRFAFVWAFTAGKQSSGTTTILARRLTVSPGCRRSATDSRRCYLRRSRNKSRTACPHVRTYRIAECSV